MSKQTLHPASAGEADALWPAVNAAHLFDSHARFQQFRADAPWRVQVTDRGEAVVLEEWRSHLDVLAMRGLWCAGDRVPELTAQIAHLAAIQGYGRVLSPLVAEEVAPVYQGAGMAVCDTIVALRLDRRGPKIAGPVLPAGVRLRHALADDLPELVRIDAECFNEFWCYDADRISRYFAEDRLIVAEGPEGVMGYTLSTVVQGSGTLGRLAVRPSARHLGTGEALLRDALAYLVRTGDGTVSLCTQEDNQASRALYRKIGMAELPGRLVFLMGPAGHAVERE
jgi:ribosomal-protein-alanine N-acetyltransferase